jgi:hypothetical protein
MRQPLRRRLLFLAALAGCATSHPQPSDPHLVVQGRFVPSTDTTDESKEFAWGGFGVPVMIHGRAFQLFVDHGANSTGLTDSTVERLKLPHQFSSATRADTLVRRNGVAVVPDTTANVLLTRGDTTFEYWGDFEPMLLDSLRLGRSRQDSVLMVNEAVAASLSPFDGLLGRDILSEFDLLFDMPAGTLRLYEPRTLGPLAGFAAGECLPATRIMHTGIDTASLDEGDRKEMSHNPAKRFWDASELKLPLLVNGRPFDALFDSGSGATIMNWAEAETVGIHRGTPSVSPYMAGGLAVFYFHRTRRSAADSAMTPYRDSTFRVAGVSVQIGRRSLPADTLFISDPTFADYPAYLTKPMMLIGLRQLRDQRLLLSYGTGQICVGR